MFATKVGPGHIHVHVEITCVDIPFTVPKYSQKPFFVFTHFGTSAKRPTNRYRSTTRDVISPRKMEMCTNHDITYFRKEFEESNRFLVTPQECENMVALAYRAKPGDRNARLVQLKKQKCRFFNAKCDGYIANSYEIFKYSEQCKYSQVPVLLDNLELDGVTKPPPETLLRDSSSNSILFTSRYIWQSPLHT